MQSATRIMFCRLAFFLVALLPTCLVTAWAVQRSQPIYRNAQQADWESFLSQRLGVQAKVAKLDYPSFWVARLDGLELTDPESQVTLLSCRSLEATRTKTAWLVEASQPQLTLDRLADLAHLLDQRLLREMSPQNLPCEFSIGELTLKFGDQAQSITQVSIVCRPIESGAEFTAQFHIAGNESAAPCRLSVRRTHSASGEVLTSWEFASESVSLPCSLVSSWIPPFKSLGNSSQFVGLAKGTVSQNKFSSELQGRLLQVDLDALVTPHSIHRVSGLADVGLSPLKLENGRIVELQGTIDCRGGYVSDSLLNAAQEHGHFGTDNMPLLVQDGLVAYRRLAARFQVAGGGIVIQGTADPTRSGVIMSAATQTLLLDPTQQPVPATALVRMLVPTRELQVPAAQETLHLLQAFPPTTANDIIPLSRPRVQLRDQ